MKANTQAARPGEQRENERIAIALAGKLFVPAEEEALDCTVVNLSVAGAGLYCPEPPPLGAFVILYVHGFGRYEGVTTRFVKGELGLKFICNEAKRKRLQEHLAGFVSEGMVGITRLRRYPRAAAASQIGHFTGPDGNSTACELLDISFQGALLKTTARPPIGEIVHLGQTRGWVVRHHDRGIGVQFQQRLQNG